MSTFLVPSAVDLFVPVALRDKVTQMLRTKTNICPFKQRDKPKKQTKKKWFPVYTKTVKKSFLKFFILEGVFGDLKPKTCLCVDERPEHNGKIRRNVHFCVDEASTCC